MRQCRICSKEIEDFELVCQECADADADLERKYHEQEMEE